jgi:hypothetical protein
MNYIEFTFISDIYSRQVCSDNKSGLFHPEQRNIVESRASYSNYNRETKMPYTKSRDYENSLLFFIQKKGMELSKDDALLWRHIRMYLLSPFLLSPFLLLCSALSTS